MNLTNINRSLRGLIRELLLMPANSIRPANPKSSGAPAEDLALFGTVLLSTFGPTGWADSRFENTPTTESTPMKPVKETVIGQQKISASVQFFGEGAYTQAIKLGNLFQTSPAIERMANLGLGFVRVTPAKNLTALSATEWEERGQVEVEFNAIVSESISTPSFGSFPVEVDTVSLTNIQEVFEP